MAYSKSMKEYFRMMKPFLKFKRPNHYWKRKIPTKERVDMYLKLVMPGIKKYNKWLNQEIDKLKRSGGKRE